MHVYIVLTEVSLEAVSSQSVSEGDGLVEDFITISKDGKSELPLSFTIGVAQDGQTTAQQGCITPVY